MIVWCLARDGHAGLRAKEVNMDGYSCVVANAINIPELCIIATLLLYHSQLKMFYKLEIADFIPFVCCFFHSFILCFTLISHYSLHFVVICLLFTVSFRMSLFVAILTLCNFCDKSITLEWNVRENMFFDVILSINISIGNNFFAEARALMSFF